jgi:hypothetical protein
MRSGCMMPGCSTSTCCSSPTAGSGRPMRSTGWCGCSHPAAHRRRHGPARAATASTCGNATPRCPGRAAWANAWRGMRRCPISPCGATVMKAPTRSGPCVEYHASTAMACSAATWAWRGPRSHRRQTPRRLPLSRYRPKSRHWQMTLWSTIPRRWPPSTRPSATPSRTICAPRSGWWRASAASSRKTTPRRWTVSAATTSTACWRPPRA